SSPPKSSSATCTPTRRCRRCWRKRPTGWPAGTSTSEPGRGLRSHEQAVGGFQERAHRRQERGAGDAVDDAVVDGEAEREDGLAGGTVAVPAHPVAQTADAEDGDVGGVQDG